MTFMDFFLSHSSVILALSLTILAVVIFEPSIAKKLARRTSVVKTELPCAAPKGLKAIETRLQALAKINDLGSAFEGCWVNPVTCNGVLITASFQLADGLWLTLLPDGSFEAKKDGEQVSFRWPGLRHAAVDWLAAVYPRHVRGCIADMEVSHA